MKLHFSSNVASESALSFDNLTNSSLDKETYKLYRSEWYRRAKEFDPGPAPLAVVCELVSTCNLGCSMCYTITDEFKSKVTKGYILHRSLRGW